MRYGEGIPVRHRVKSQRSSHITNVVTTAGLHSILMFAPTNCTAMPGGFAACMSYDLYIFLADIHSSSTVLFYRLQSVLLCVLHGRYAASAGVIYIFEHLHTSTVMHYNNSASLRLHASNATSASTPQEYSMMYFVCFFPVAFALTNI